jgi:hypothetical protein
MEPTTLLAISGVAALFAAGAFAAKRRKPNVSLIDDAKTRAAKRVQQRAFADTQPMDDWSGMMPERVEAIELCDKFDGRGDLSEDEKRIIGRILDDVVMAQMVPMEHKEVPDPWSSAK